ncbi:protein Niban 1 isoform X2 [Passer domesticus]|uniref:protein Niban 1 isoform X2 n=1 Tax=Passer domesticus TaxID=48849 RepID=UPI0030FF2036
MAFGKNCFSLIACSTELQGQEEFQCRHKKNNLTDTAGEQQQDTAISDCEWPNQEPLLKSSKAYACTESHAKGKTEATIKNFSPHYRRQHAVAFCRHVQEELEQHRHSQSRFLKTRPAGEAGTVLYEAEVLHFAEDLKKWKDRYVVIKNDYTVDCFETKEAYQKGASPKYHVLPAGGKVLTSEEDYNLLSDKHFPDPVGSSEEAAAAFVPLPKEFPVYLWQPFSRHSYYCFPEPGAQQRFSAVLGDCVRHSNHDFLKQTTYEVEAFLEAIQFFRQEKGHYGTWEMITGNEKQILSNLVMEELLPNLQTMILPKMKGKRNDRKRAWFGIVEETYGLVQQQVAEGLSTLKEECREFAKTLEGTIRSDMDQILNSKNFLAGKIKASVSEPAQKCCTENIQPFLTSILEELMGPVSSGFTEVRALFDKEVNEIIQDFQKTNDMTRLKENVDQLMTLPFNSVKMEPCYLKVNLLQELLQDLKSRFKVYHIDFVIQRTQNFMQELMENAVYTFEQLFSPSHQADSAKVATTIEKVKLRVLKQYDYDSSTIRKKIFQEALVQITLPTMQKTLASTCKPELQKYEQYIFADYTSVIQVENVYEEILHQMLLEEALKVINEAAVLRKHNLFEDNLSVPCESVSSLTELRTPVGSAQGTPAKAPAAPRAESSDTESHGDETLVVTGKIVWEKDANEGKSADKEAGASAGAAGDQASRKEAVAVTDIGDKQESPSPGHTKQGAAEGKSALENVSECVVSTEGELKAQQKAVEEKVASGTDTAVKNVEASPKKELKVPEGAVEEEVTSESQKVMAAVSVSGTEKASTAQEKVSEIKLTFPPESVTDTEILGSAEKKSMVENETGGKLSQSENALGAEFEWDSKKESGESTETKIVSQDEKTGKAEFGDSPKKESHSEEKSSKSPDDVNEIRSLLMLTVEIPADTPAENIKEVCEGELLKLQEHRNGNYELSEVAVAEIQVSPKMKSEDAAECVEFKEERPSSASLGTDGTRAESVPRGAQAPWLVESWAPPREAKAEVESKPSVWHAGAGGERLQPEEHTGNAVDGEQGTGNSHAVPGEAATQSSFPSPAADAATRDVPILDRANPGPGLLEPVSLEPVSLEPVSPEPVSPEPVSLQPVSLQPVSPESVSLQPVSPEPVSLEPVSLQPVSLQPVSPGPVSPEPQPGAERTAGTEPGRREGEPGDQPSSLAGIQSTGGKAILPEEHREDGPAQQNSEE